jgi:hypothetical protein
MSISSITNGPPASTWIAALLFMTVSFCGSQKIGQAIERVLVGVAGASGGGTRAGLPSRGDIH